VNLIHLTKQQLILRKGSRMARLAYVLGVLTLGVPACIVSLVAYSLFPFIVVCSKQAGKKYRGYLDPNIKRIPHLFKEYIPAAAAA
jgi:hypothetical protein